MKTWMLWVQSRLRAIFYFAPLCQSWQDLEENSELYKNSTVGFSLDSLNAKLFMENSILLPPARLSEISEISHFVV